MQARLMLNPEQERIRKRIGVCLLAWTSEAQKHPMLQTIFPPNGNQKASNTRNRKVSSI